MNNKITKIGSLPGKKELETSLKERRIPIKFCYPGEGGDKWDELVGQGGKDINKNYPLGKREEAIIKNSIHKINSLLKAPFNIIHIGVGNGRELPYISKIIDFKLHRYFGVDISQQMIDNTLKYQKEILSQMPYVSFILTDVENNKNLKLVCEFAKQRGHKRNLLLITGQGVLSSNPEFHKGVAEALEEGDYALYALEGDDLTKRDEILKTYDVKEVHNLLKVGLRRAGIKKGRFLPAQFNGEEHVVEIYFEEDNGRKILCLTSYKPESEEELNNRFKIYGLNPISVNFLKEPHAYSIFCEGGKNVQ